MADTHNSVTIFSNGQAHMRVYRKVKKGEVNEFSLPFRKESMEDVLASFGVFNPNIRYVRPASFMLPTQKGSITLGNSTFETLASLRGAKVKLKRGNNTIEGTVFNTDTQNQIVNNQIAQTRYLSILTTTGLTTVPWQEVTDLTFEEKEIQTEIEKALAANRQKLKPDAVFLNVALQSKPAAAGQQDKDEDALITWVEQLVPWKLSYRMTRRDNGKYLFDLFGVATNPTDTDWNDTLITLVNGKPLTFISDLDKQTIVHRQGVNLADAVAKGGFIPETGMLADAADDDEGLEAFGGGHVAGGVPKAARRAAIASMAPAAAPQMASVSNIHGSQLMNRGQASFPATVQAEDVGDFCVYKQDHPMSIAAGSAATIPLFSTELNDSKKVLIYDPRQSQAHPFQAIQFKNETKQSLGLGVCVVFERGLFQGKCVQTPTKPGETAMLFYAEETGVRVMPKSHISQALPRRLKVHEGAVISTTFQQSRTSYTIKNVKDEQFTLLIEYTRLLNPASKLACGDAKVVEELTNGVRYSVTVPAKGTVNMTVVEEYTGSQSYDMTDANWFLNSFIMVDDNIQTDKQIKAIITQNKKVAEKAQEIAKIQAKIQKATQNKNHLVGVVQLGQNAGNLQEYQKDLQEAMKTIKDQGQNLEAAQEAQQKEQAKLYELLQKLSGEWAYEDTKNGQPAEEVAAAK